MEGVNCSSRPKVSAVAAVLLSLLFFYDFGMKTISVQEGISRALPISSLVSFVLRAATLPRVTTRYDRSAW